jgi:neurofibromin 1
MNTDLTDLMLLGCMVFDRNRLVMVLNGQSFSSIQSSTKRNSLAVIELSSLLVNMAREAQLAIAIPLRSAIWNWIDTHPHEFNEITRTSSGATSSRSSKTEGAPERVFDLISSKMRVSASGGGSGGSGSGGAGGGGIINIGGGPGAGVGDERIVWPTLTALCCMISERLAVDYVKFSGKGYKLSRKVRFSLPLFSFLMIDYVCQRT